MLSYVHQMIGMWRIPNPIRQDPVIFLKSEIRRILTIWSQRIYEFRNCCFSPIYLLFIQLFIFVNHRLNGSSNPVLTATCLSYGSLCDFLGFFPQPTWRSHPSTDFDAKWLIRRGFMNTCAFWSKNRNFLEPQTPKTAKICPILVGT